MDLRTSVALLSSEISSGKILACLTRVRSDVEVEVSYPIDVIRQHGPRQFSGYVKSITHAGTTTVILTLTLEKAVREILSGCYFLLSVPGTQLKRPYSPASISSDLPEVRFFIRLLQSGAMSDYLLNRACIGDEIGLDGPYGSFRWKETRAPLIFVAGGTGLAPIASMLGAIAHRRRHRNTIQLFFGVTRLEDLFYLDELEISQALLPRFTTHISVFEPSAAWSGFAGHVTDLLASHPLAADSDAYLCGPAPMIEKSTQILLQCGLPPSAIHFEAFLPATRSVANGGLTSF
jgi:NAD(P)H-flavin reductase